MISFNRLTKIFVSREPTDMRASYDTLFSKVKGVLNQDSFTYFYRPKAPTKFRYIANNFLGFNHWIFVI